MMSDGNFSSAENLNPGPRLQEFVDFVRTHISGDEKGEAQIFCDRLFRSFGHEGVMEAGGTLEFRVQKGKSTKFADLLWRPRLLIEMKKRGENLAKHYQQAFEYWLNLVPDRPRYVILCNFDEFWIYDFNHQLDEPLDRIALADLPSRYTALNFLFPIPRKPLFNNDRVAVTRSAAMHMATLFGRLQTRDSDPIDRERAQRFILQCVVAMFAEDSRLLPKGLFSELLGEAVSRRNTFDVLGGLFKQMASPVPTEGGWYKNVPYFNGGLFEEVRPVELGPDEISHLVSASSENWSQVHPAIFGSLFEGSMDQEERHAFGAHFTTEADIYKVVLPTIVRPWRDQIELAGSPEELLALRQRLLGFRVLDPACGSGNFLYIAYRELKRLEVVLLEKLAAFGGKRKVAGRASLVSASQMYGIDVKPFAVELAKVTLMIGKVMALRETTERLSAGQQHLLFDSQEMPLPLDNLNDNFVVGDALLSEDGSPRSWPVADVIIGNPPFLGAKRLKPLRGADYVNKLRKQYRSIPGLADYCVYWFRKAHESLPEWSAEDPVAGRAGLVGTQNVRSNVSRKAGLDHIVASGTIVEAVDNQPWSGEAAVHVSIVNWVKSTDPLAVPGQRRLWSQAAATPSRDTLKTSESPNSSYELIFRDVSIINSALSADVDVSTRVRLLCNVKPKRCFQGKIPGYSGFLVDAAKAEELKRDSEEVIFPYLTGRELLDEFAIERWIIDFGRRDMAAASTYRSAFQHCKVHVLPAVEEAARLATEADSDMSGPRQEHLQRWWQLWNRRDELTTELQRIPRYIGCSRVGRRPIMVFLSPTICPSDLVQVFALPDDYSFGILQSSLHFEWLRTSSRLKIESDLRYSVRSVFETFAWPQSPSLADVEAIASAARRVREARADSLRQSGGGLRDLYRLLELPGRHPLREAHLELDEAVMAAYGNPATKDPLAMLMEMNADVAKTIQNGGHVESPGLPSGVVAPQHYISADAYTIGSHDSE